MLLEGIKITSGQVIKKLYFLKAKRVSLNKTTLLESTHSLIMKYFYISYK